MSNNRQRNNAVAFAKAKRDKAVAFAATNVKIRRLLEALRDEDNNEEDNEDGEE